MLVFARYIIAFLLNAYCGNCRPNMYIYSDGYTGTKYPHTVSISVLRRELRRGVT
jgi:hypothetical protein